MNEIRARDLCVPYRRECHDFVQHLIYVILRIRVTGLSLLLIYFLGESHFIL